MGEDRSALQALVDNFALLGREGLTTLLVPWLAIAAVDFGFVALSVAVVWLAGGAEVGAGAGLAIQLIAIVQVILILSLRVALLSTVRRVAFEGAEAVGSLGAVVQNMIGRIGPSILITLVMGIIVTVGFILCVIPGLVALFFFAFAPYLVAARGTEIVAGLQESARWARREWLLLVTALLVAIVVSGAIACVVGLVTGAGFRAVVAVPAGLFGGWVFNTILGYIAFLWWGAVYVTAESRMQVQTLRRTAPVSGEGPQGPGGGPGPRVRPESGEDSGPQIYERPGPERPGFDSDQGSSSSSSSSSSSDEDW